eukprot:SAG31_NODE_10796_length_1096_cov_1.551655_2_plen_35_part_01
MAASRTGGVLQLLARAARFVAAQPLDRRLEFLRTD